MLISTLDTRKNTVFENEPLPSGGANIYIIL